MVGIIAVQSKMLERTDRERLTKHGFIKEVMRGWYIPSSPDEQQGDVTLAIRPFVWRIWKL